MELKLILPYVYTQTDLLLVLPLDLTASRQGQIPRPLSMPDNDPCSAGDNKITARMRLLALAFRGLQLSTVPLPLATWVFSLPCRRQHRWAFGLCRATGCRCNGLWRA